MNKEKQDISNATSKVFNETNDFVVVGLTGRTGSGSSTVSKILSGEDLNKYTSSTSHFQNENERRKYKIVNKYLQKHWVPFTWLKVRCMITDYILEHNIDDFVNYLIMGLNADENKTKKQINKIKDEFEEVLKLKPSNESLKNIKSLNPIDIENNHKYYIENLLSLSNSIRDVLNQIDKELYIKAYQKFGDNIRSSSSVYDSEFNDTYLFSLPMKINTVLKVIRQFNKNNNKPTRVIIDAFRNPYEILFFKERYSDFFVMSITVEEEIRIKSLKNRGKYTNEQIKKINNKEYPESSLRGLDIIKLQNIQKCSEMSDIHIYNPTVDCLSKENELVEQLSWYLALMLHPGLITPTADERCMEIAYASKVSSGCISRQVGAVVVDKFSSVKAVGWNSTPRGHVPCVLRSAEDLIGKINDESAYSDYEQNNTEFRNKIENKFSKCQTKCKEHGRNLSYCFKDIQNEIDNEKNQIHTRSMHAEENAFLQITKYGGIGVENGTLYTTASPCELCSKKAYQLGISRIVYIDPYPGISNEHILACGDTEHRPKLELFRGAVGSAYYKLYMPFMPFKDELASLLGYDQYRDNKNQTIEEQKEEILNLKREIISLKKNKPAKK